jgi:hypothetical protein
MLDTRYSLQSFRNTFDDVLHNIRYDFTAKRDQTAEHAENAESMQRSRELFLGELRASSATSAVKEVFAGEFRYFSSTIAANITPSIRPLIEFCHCAPPGHGTRAGQTRPR